MITTAREFRIRFRWLILLAWTVPPVVGLSFLLLIRMFSVEQIMVILTTPLEPLFNILALIGAMVYFERFSAPIAAHLRDPGKRTAEAALKRMRRFPLNFWGLFLGYLLLAPSSVILSAQTYTDFQATPGDWFRIHLVALVVSIIVGLPIFFRVLNLFGTCLRDITLTRPHLSIRAKVFLVGALVPLLVDTVLVLYYWTRTGYFGVDTFVVWLLLELLAVAGSVMFARSFGQSLQPLKGVIKDPTLSATIALDGLVPHSTDELGVITTGFRRLLRDLNVHNDILELSNRLLASSGDSSPLAEVSRTIIRLGEKAFQDDRLWVLLHDTNANELVAVAQSGAGYDPRGHFRRSLDETSAAVWCFKHQQSLIVSDAGKDPRVCPDIREGTSVRSVLAMPLIVEGQAIGVLMTTSRRRRDYSPDQIALMENLSREAALAVHTHILQGRRLAAEAQCRDREEQFSLLLQSSPEAIYGVDLNGICTFVNRACVRILGYDSEEQLLGQNMHELIHHTRADGTPYPKERCFVRHAMLAGQEGHSDDEIHWRADGSSFPTEYWSHPMYKDGELIGAVVTFSDITERKKAEGELRRLHESNRLLLESTGEGIFGVDLDMRCTFINRAAASMLGYDQAELLGQDMHALVHHSHEDGDAYALAESSIYRAIAEQRSFRAQDEVLWRQDGSSFPVHYLVNPIRDNDVVTGAVVVFRNVTETRAMARKMDYLATHDPLTGLFNRREFERRLEAAVYSSRVDGARHVLCYLDLDQFKLVNDTCGHIAGDELLRQLTALLHGKLRQTDTLGRLGGDEFGVLFEGCPLEQGLEIANELRRVVEDFRFVWEDKHFTVGTSIGVVAIDGDTADAAHALSAADAACYVAKDTGRNRVHVYQVHDKEMMRRRGEMQWVARIHDALQNGKLLVAYQPIIPVNAPADSGLQIEVLVRMRDDDGGEIPPGAFIPAAERYNVMSNIDRWVVHHVFTWLMEHPDVLNEMTTCFINLSGQSLSQSSFAQFVKDELDRHHIPGYKICLEVTETAAVANLSRAVHFIRDLKHVGCRFALDDFGSGMSSFAYLKNLPVDFLKIDGNFVRDIVTDPVDRAMVEAIHQVGQVMGIITIAESVEDAAILDHLRSMGIHYAQGHSLARPRMLDELAHRPRTAVQKS